MGYIHITHAVLIFMIELTVTVHELTTEEEETVAGKAHCHSGLFYSC